MNDPGQAPNRAVAETPATMNLLCQVLAEFVGTLLLTLIGDSVLAVLILSRAGTAGLAAAPLGWALAVFVGVLVSGTATGGHLNPAVTIGLASAGMFPWARTGAYIIAQYLGGFVGAALVYAVYRDAIHRFDGGKRVIYGGNATAPIFSCFPAPGVSLTTCLVDQVVSTAILLIAISAITDKTNMDLNKGQQRAFVGLSIAACMYAFGYNCGNPLNPARDLAPRVFTAIAGWGFGVYKFRGKSWFWVPVVGPHLGAVLGVWIYKLGIHNNRSLMPEERCRSAAEGTREPLHEDVES